MDEKVQEQKAPEKQVEKKKDQQATPERETNLHRSGEGFNLIAPQLKKVEEEKQEKFRLDIRVVLFVFFVVLVSLGVVGYNWYVNMILNNEKAKLENLESELKEHEYTIRANDQIVERYELYSDILEGFISSKEVLNFWQEVSVNLAEIRGIELTRGVNFEVRGRAETLRDVTELWHFLSIDDRVQSVTLEGLAIPRQQDDEVSFSFKGVLNLEYFNKRR